VSSIKLTFAGDAELTSSSASLEDAVPVDASQEEENEVKLDEGEQNR